MIVDAGGWRLRGWIRTFEPTLALGGHGTLSYGYGCSMAFAELPTEAIVPRGTWLYDAPGGDAVGRVTHDTLYVDAPGEDHVAITELTPWGSVPLGVEPWDVLPVEPLAP